MNGPDDAPVARDQVAELLAVIELGTGHAPSPEEVATFCLRSASLLCGQLAAAQGGKAVAHEDRIALLEQAVRERNEVIDLLHKSSHRLAQEWTDLADDAETLSRQIDDFHGELRGALQLALSHAQSADRIRSGCRTRG